MRQRLACLLVLAAAPLATAEDLPDGARARLGEKRDRPVPLLSVAFSPDSRLVAAGQDDGRITLWDATTARIHRSWRAHDGSVLSLAFSPDGKRLASGGRDGTVRLWDPATAYELHVIRERRAVYRVVFAPHEDLLATAGQNGDVALWDPATGKEVRRTAGHRREVFPLAFHPDGKQLATGSKDHTVLLCDVETGRCHNATVATTGWVSTVAFSPDGLLLVTAGQHGQLRVWETLTERFVVALPSDDPASGALLVARDNRTIVWTGGSRHQVYLWDFPTQRLRDTFSGHREFVSALAASPDGRTLASASYDGLVYLW